VDAFAAVVGAPPRKLFVPAELMDELWDGRASLARGEVQAKIDIRSTERPDELQRQRFLLSFLVQRLAPHLHPWNRSVVFSIERLQQDVGWRPEYTFESAVEQTYAWFRRERLAETARFDWGWEDQLLRLVETRRAG